MKKYIGLYVLPFSLILSACGFHLQGEMNLAEPFHRVYLQTSDPYGTLARNLKQILAISHAKIVAQPADANIILAILQEETSQQVLSVSSTQQSRQIKLKLTVSFEINDRNGITIINPQSLSEERTMTVQANQILGSSNEANLFYEQMRRTIAYAVINRIASKEVTHAITVYFTNKKTGSTSR